MATTAPPKTPNVQMAPIETTNGRHFLSICGDRGVSPYY